MFSNSLKLISLSLAHNRLTILPDNIFMGLSSLLTLDLSHNHIMAIDDNSLSGTGLKTIGKLSRENNKSVR